MLYVAIDRTGAWLRLPDPPLRFDIPALAILVSQILLLATTALLALREDSLRKRSFWLLAIPLLMYLIVAGLSRFWSINLDTTVKRYWFLAAVTFGGIFIGMQFRRREILQLYEVLSILLIVGSLALILKYPKFAIDTEYDLAGAWRGMLKYKGYAGSIMALAATVFLVRISSWKDMGWPRRVFVSAFLGAALVLVYQAKSATAQIAFLASAVAFLLGIAWLRWRHAIALRRYIVVAAFSGLLLLLGLFAVPSVLALFGRDVTLTGRIPLWRTLLPEISARPFLGWGFGEAFWLSAEVQRVWQVITWKPGTAHSGLVELVLDTGLVGLAAVLALLGTTAALVGRYVREHPTKEALIFPMWLVLIVLVNVGENLLGTYELFFWLALVITFAHAAKEAVSATPSSASQTTVAQKVQGGSPPN